jgi:hypothetical protein
MTFSLAACNAILGKQEQYYIERAAWLAAHNRESEAEAARQRAGYGGLR